jgi:2-polyprenyl-3-methyl-5-hydroxy-6-metoxy-1,4-benzoquinol methylase
MPRRAFFKKAKVYADCTGRWNHNIHYHPVLLAAMPDRCARALDIGCGEGSLARALRQSVAHVSAIDIDEESIEVARRQGAYSGIDYILGDFLTLPFAPGSFDFVTCAAALHHMDVDVALRRMRELLRPGGTLAILGLARSSYPADLPRDIAATMMSHVYRRTKSYWESSAPTVWPPPQTYREVRLLAERTLPRARFRRHLLWRYSIIWTKPTIPLRA